MTDKPTPPQSPGLREALETAIRPFLNSLEAFKFHSDSTVITNSDLRRSGTMPNHYLTVRDLRGLAEALAAPSPVLPPSGVEALRRIKNYPHSGDATAQGMAAIAREALGQSGFTVEKLNARFGKGWGPYGPSATPDLGALLLRARQFVADSGCDEDDTDVNINRNKLLAEIDRALAPSPAPDNVTDRLARVDASLARQLSESIALNSKLKIENDRLRALPPALDPGTVEASKSSWSKIDKELSAYIETIHRELIEKCAQEALRRDTHALFCMADTTAIRSDIADRIRALTSPASGGE